MLKLSANHYINNLSLKKRLLILAAFLLFILILISLYYTLALSKVENVYISNVSGKSLVISWTTQKSTETSIKVQGMSKTFIDNRDKINPQKRKSHYVTITGLTPATRYKLNIYQLLIPLFEQKAVTGPILTLPKQNPVYGTILDKDAKTPLKDSIIYLRALEASRSSALLSTLPNSKGGWSIDLSNARIRNLQKNFPQKITGERLIIQTLEGKRFKAETITHKDKPWPTISVK